jgi:signal transduction histidine kinase
MTAPIRILLVEDDPEDAEYLAAILDRAHDVQFEIERVDRLSSALTAATKTRPDVVLLDLTLPDAEGLKTVRRARLGFGSIPFLVLTGFHDEALGVDAVQEGAQDYLVKDKLDAGLIIRAVRYAIERQRAADEAANLRQREALQREFVANVSHELRTPLTAIKASLESLRRGGLSDPPTRERFIAAIERQTEHLARLVEEMLAVATLESGGLGANPQALELGTIVRQMLDDFASKAAAAKISLSADGFDKMRVWADPDHLIEILHNLTENAIKYNKTGGSVRITAQESDGAVEVTVSDTGVGIAKDETPLIFTPFHRTRYATSKKISGTGLGLSITKRAVERNGGRLWFESDPGKGSHFHFTLPRA